jgi:hypothetical protein
MDGQSVVREPAEQDVPARVVHQEAEHFGHACVASLALERLKREVVPDKLVEDLERVRFRGWAA